MSKFGYATCCVNSDAESIIDMVDRARPIKLSTFRRHCDSREWEARWYPNGMRVDRDYHVRFYRSRFQGQPCYFIVHSAIEYIWTPGGQ